MGPIMGVGRSHLLKEQAEIMSQVTEPAIRAHRKEAGVPVCRQKSQSTQASRTLSAKKVCQLDPKDKKGVRGE